MTYANCPQCGLSIRLRSPQLIVEHCPRCLARRRVAVPTVTSTGPLPAPGHRLAIKTARQGETVLVLLGGELDDASGLDLARELRRVRHVGHVIIDLESIRFIDGAGVRALVRARHQARQPGASVTLCNPSAVVRRAFRLAGLEELLGATDAPGAGAAAAPPDPPLAGTLSRAG